MKKFILIPFIFLTSFSINAQVRIPNQSTPRNTVEELFRCARTGDLSLLHMLCDPLNEGDGDTKDLCTINELSFAVKKEFRTYFKLAYTLDEKIIKEIGAKVHFIFGPKAEKHETMKLIKRQNKWYLSSF